MQRLWLLVLSLLAGTAGAAELEHFSPQGEQLDVRQARARFSAPMAPPGGTVMAPFDVACGQGGSGHWADERTWVFDVPASLLPGATCRFTTRSGLTTLGGEAVTAAPEYAFHIAGPRVLWSLPGAGDRVDENQVFVLVLNGPATATSVEGHVHCDVQGIHEQIGVRHLEAGERHEVLALDEVKAALQGVDADHVELVQCRRPLPAAAKLALVWGRGVATASGQANTADQSLAFTVREHFVARLRCSRENNRAGCVPLSPIALEFTAPVPAAALDRITLKDRKGKAYPRTAIAGAPRTLSRIEFPAPFPAEAELTLNLPDGLRDDAGRALVNHDRFPLAVRIGKLPPLVKFAGDFGIVERNTGGLLPITLRNLEPGPGGTAAKLRWLRLETDPDIIAWKRRLHEFDHPRGTPRPDTRRASLLTADTPNLVQQALPKSHGAEAFEVVGVPLRQPGYYVLEAESRHLGQSLLGADQPVYVRASALVTNLAVHFKWGPRNSLAWVTTLDQGKPVAGARIAVLDCRGRQLAQASTDARGMSLIPAGLPDPRASDEQCPLHVSARAGDDLAFAASDWDAGIETWRFDLPYDWQQEDRVAHSILDRSLFRPGDTVHMKHILRDKRLAGLGYPQRLPRTLEITHAGSNQRWFLPLAWTRGAALTDWKIPLAAKRGDYILRLLDKAIAADAALGELEWQPGLDSGRFVVGDFRVPLMRATLTPTGGDLVAADAAGYDVNVGYLNGGGARGLAVKLRARLEPRRQVEFAAYSDYRFAGVIEDSEANSVALPGESLQLDAGGSGRARLAGIPAQRQPQRLRVELEYPDPNGEVQTVSHSRNWWPAAVVLGVKRLDWVKAGNSTRLDFLAVDPSGRPLADVPVAARPLLRQTFSHRQRLAGGFYGYHNEVRDTPLEGSCTGRTNKRGKFACTVTPGQSGEIVIAAEARDRDGRVATTAASFWVAGQGEWWFDQDNHDRIDLLPEKKSYQPGDKARFQVRMPFRKATALVTVERDGVLDARVLELSGKSPVIELPVQANWAPNVYVSALVVRGRVDGIVPTALVDLGKPAFKLGIAGIQVGRQAHRLEVKVQSDRTEYQVREKAKISLRVRTADGKVPPPDTDVAVAVVDEGLLELADNHSWELLAAMMAERGYNMRTFTAQMQVTGKRHFGRKAVPGGGGGGRQPSRELFDTLLYWKPGVALDTKGEAHVEVPLNDSLTRFRVVAVAAAENRFGSGHTGIRSRQDLQIVPGLAPVVREGDRIQAYLSVRNGSDRFMRVRLEAKVAGLPPAKARFIGLEPGASEETVWPIQVPQGVTRLDWVIDARQADGKAADSVKASQRVEAAVPVRPVSGNLYRLDKPLDLPVAAPDGALPGRGEVRATFAASLIDGQSGVRDYMRRYPYACLEQKVSRAVATADAKAWAELAEALPGYLDDRGLAAFFPGLGRGSVALTSYLVAISDEAGLALPADARARMLKALEDYVAGRGEPEPGPWRHGLAATAQRLAALDALARQGPVSAELVATVKPEPQRWPVSLIADWIDLLKRSPHLPEQTTRLKAAEDALRARMSYTGQRLNLGDDPGLWWMMTSADTGAVRALLAVLELPGWKDDIPRLLAGTLARQSRGHWDTTTANAWGTLALQRHGGLFDAVRPAGQSRAELAGQARVVDWQAYARGATASFPLPERSDTLRVRHDGAGAPYLSLALLAAVPTTQPIRRGYGIERELVAIERKQPDKWSRGDIVRVRLTVDARDDMGWVVVDDPVPAGASVLGGGLKRDSAILAGGEQPTGDAWPAWPAWQERAFDSFRAYYEYVPRGRFTLEYTLRLNNAGRYNLPSTRVEAMYAPEMYGEAPNGEFVVH